MQRGTGNTFYRTNLGLPLLLAVVVFLLFDLTDLDRVLSNLIYDPSIGLFPLEHNELFEKVTHKWPRIIPNWTGEIAIIGSLLSFIWPRFAKHPNARITVWLEKIRLAPVLRFTTRHRRDFLFVVVAFALSTGVIHYLKSHTSVYCPVETTLYGGTEIRKEWWENFSLLHKAGAGRCWPGGHASSAFSLFALYFVARRYRWQHSKKLLYVVLLLGFVYGTTRVFQGWHYMSHTLWSGIFVWLSSLSMALVFYGRAKLAMPINDGAAKDVNKAPFGEKQIV
ncbi:phosphatase PAP2 family protein [Pseudomonas akapageensis]|uniref:phosphatase PAP2 family protein n=1 Tax=Pseudomonas akapageensis TaxID=2609961 RepID=UPI00140AFC26|nr:phosphatase PAP2 family protein [Pseudomonas akapageensis]